MDVDEKLPIPTDPEEGSAEGEEGAAPDEQAFDMDAFSERLSETAREAVSREEFNSVKRDAGMTRTLQRDLARMQEELKKGPANAVTREEYDLLLDSVAELLPDDRRAALVARKEARGVEQVVDSRFSDFEKRVFKKLGIADDDEAPAPKTSPTGLSPEAEHAVLTAAWRDASTAVLAHAQRRGVTVTQEDLTAAQTAVGDYNPRGAVEALVKLIDSRAASGGEAPATGRQARVAERKGAASGDATVSTSTSSGSQGRVDLTTIAGLARARKSGAIDSDTFYQKYRQLTS